MLARAAYPFSLRAGPGHRQPRPQSPLPLTGPYCLTRLPSLRCMVGLDDIEQAAEKLLPVLRPTPAQFSGALTTLVGRPVFVKPEHFQRTGSFKNPGRLQQDRFPGLRRRH